MLEPKHPLSLKSCVTIVLVASFGCAWGTTAHSSKLPLPRFVSLRAAKVNAHVGPGLDYPTIWVYQKQFLPVEIIQEFDTWRQIRDYDGKVSWVHQSLLSGRRTIMTQKARQSLLEKPYPDARVVAYLDPGVVLQLKKCQGPWCLVVATEGHQGWLKREGLWGVYGHEVTFK